MSDDLRQDATGRLGNTKTPPAHKQSRKWCFTLNNYTEDERSNIIDICETKKWRYIIGREVGDKEFTPHLQGYIEHRSAIRFSTMKRIMPRAKLIKAKGSRFSQWKYCSKDEDFVEKGIMPMREKLKRRVLNSYENTHWRPWQKYVLKIISEPADSRKINWFWEKTGNIGKSYLAKYLVAKYGAILADGKKDNIFNQINNNIENDKEIKLIIIDIPRYSLEYINYGLMEQIKNGLIYSGKYEGGICIFPSPHVIVLANKEPERHKMSKDRWNIIHIRENEERSDDSDISSFD